MKESIVRNDRCIDGFEYKSLRAGLIKLILNDLEHYENISLNSVRQHFELHLNFPVEIERRDDITIDGLNFDHHSCKFTEIDGSIGIVEYLYYNWKNNDNKVNKKIKREP